MSEDTTVKLTKKALKDLESRAKPFETKKDCLERIISENCSRNNKTEQINGSSPKDEDGE